MRQRLDRSPRARRLTRFALRRFLLGDDAGRRVLGQLDERIDGLPGLAGLNLMSRAATNYGIA
jgi:hypothetical protein